MKGLNQLQKKKKTDLVKMAEKLGIKVSVRWGRPTLAKKILEKQKLDELYEEPEPQPGSEQEGPKRKPEFESLVTESIESEPGPPQAQKDGPGGVREGAGRTPGLTDEKARVQRILKNDVPDPVVQFVIECIFGLAGEPKKKIVEPTTDMLAVPITNLKEYYFPNRNLSPVLETWIGLAFGIKTLVVSRLKAKKSEPVTEPKEGDDG